MFLVKGSKDKVKSICFIYHELRRLSKISENAEHGYIIDYDDLVKSCKNIVEEVEQMKQRNEVPVSLNTPIKNVGFSVRAESCLLRHGCRTLEDVSKMTISELKKVRNLGTNSLEVITKMKEFGVELKDGKDDVEEKKVDLDASLEVLNLSNRVKNCLLRHGFETVNDLCKTSLYELNRVRGISAGSIKEIIEKLEMYGVTVLEGVKNEIQKETCDS